MKEQVLRALHDALDALASPTRYVGRNITAPPANEIPQGGVVILRDGDPGEPQTTLGRGRGAGPFYYQHEAEVELHVEAEEPAERDRRFAELEQAVDAALAADITLGGLIYGMDWAASAPGAETMEGGPTVKVGVIAPVLDYLSETRV